MCISSTRKYTLPFALVLLLLIHLVHPPHTNFLIVQSCSAPAVIFTLQRYSYTHTPNVQHQKKKKNRGEEEEEAEGERDVHVRVLTLTLMRVIILDLQFSLLIKISPALESKKKKISKNSWHRTTFCTFFLL